MDDQKTPDLKTVVHDLLANGSRTHAELAALVPCSASAISMIAIGERGKRGGRTTFYLESRLRELHATQQTATTPPAP